MRIHVYASQHMVEPIVIKLHVAGKKNNNKKKHKNYIITGKYQKLTRKISKNK